jgi:predicted nuclease of predicted toxin-antitoxin system
MSVRWLVNENLPAPSAAVLPASGHDVLPIGEAHSSMDDMAVPTLARQEGRWLVTFDRDYGDQLFVRNHAPPPTVILLRVVSYRSHEPAAWLEQLLREPESLQGKFTVFTGNTVRSRPLLHPIDT